MKLSILIPVYNVVQWLPETINSVINQTFRDFELILVDDGSNDGSGELCDTFALADSRVRVIHQENAGVSAARNTGLDAATGEFVGWVDSDDIIEVDMFQRMIELAEKHGADIVQCQHDRKETLNGDHRTQRECLMDGVAFVKRMFTKSGGGYTNQVSLCTKIYRRSLWDNIRFPEGMVYEDEMQTYKVCLKAKKIVETEDILYHYVKRENSIITGVSSRKLLDKQLALKDRMEYLPKRIPELEEVCINSFFGFSKRVLCQMYQMMDWQSVSAAMDTLFEHATKVDMYANKYDKIYLRLLKSKFFRKWILVNDFEPIQKMLGKLKKVMNFRIFC